jgi:hypothetical protein
MNAKLKMSLVLALCLAFLPSLASARVTDKAEVFDGQVVLTRLGKLNVVVLVDHLPVGGDGIADQAFIYRSTVALPADLRDFSGAGTVVVRPESIVVALLAKESVVSLSVRTEEAGNGPVRPGSLFKAASATTIDSGFELRRLYGGQGVDLVRVAFDQLKPRRGASLLFKSEEEEGGCASGGAGATDCSIEGSIAGGGVGCSVGCSSGYYACCSLRGCSCVKGSEEAYNN